jgi:hypothetical protein
MNIIIKWAQTQWDRVFAWVLVGAGALAIVLGWNGISSEPLTAQQIPYLISGGIGGLFLLGLGAMLWLSADLRDEWRRLDAIEQNTRPTAEADLALAADPFEAVKAEGRGPADAVESSGARGSRRKPHIAQ